ncbi:FG-GAP-like repeat-containing protein [Cognatilysobacter terrigena]|uniref:FG-GAP-like repeat-containing protein n=1 Tax=Cognatilysobacter terrigena TaxID=2488749 RepID=UPI0014151B0E|nr:FG-GAP-like repeat-containing protein [Lysobacter terrigena]
MAYTAGVQEVRTRAYTWKQVRLSEAHALDAIGGTMTVQAPDGHLVRLRYDHHIEHPNGDWTWVGRPAGAQPGTEAIITFGEKAVFGSIPEGKGPPLRLMQANGVSWMVQTDAAALASIPGAHPTKPDAFPVPRAAQRPASDAASRSSAWAPTAAAAAATASTTVDLVLGYTSTFASRLGGQSQANTRLNNMVDFANQAYQNSGIDARVRLVNTVQVDYADNTDNDQALYDLTGYDCSGSSCVKRAIPASLQPLRNARDQYGADLMSLVRNFDNGTNGSCGVGWILGGGQQPIDSSDAAWAMSIVSDSNGRGPGSFPSGGYVCRDETLAHEMGHNMGAQHDVATAKGDNGVLDADEYGRYPYSFGFKTDANNGNFYTTMAYGDTGQTPYRVFSNPRVATCNSSSEAPRPCGTNDADNARTLSQTMPVIATFRATVVPSGPVRRPRNDMDGDGRSDLLWWNAGSGVVAYWVMNGSQFLSGANYGLGSGLQPASSGYTTAGARADLLFRRPADRMLINFANSGSGFQPTAIGNYASDWNVAGQGDVDGDGKDDIFWRHPTAGYFAYWLMDGAVYKGGQTYAPPPAYLIAAIADFNGDGRADIVWNAPSTRTVSMWVSDGGGFAVYQIGQYGSDWSLIGAADVTGDGKADLLWRNTASTYLAYWKMDGPSFVSSQAQGTPTAYTFATTGDYNGDGRDDIVWQRPSDRALIMWLGNGIGFQEQVVGNYGADWSLLK